MSIAAERLMVEVQADVRQALRALDQVEKRSITSSSRVSKMAKSMGLAFGGAAIVSGVKKTISLAMDFDKTMRQVGVQTDQSGKSLEKLSSLAMKMGKDTVFSAQDASGAMLELAKGGMNAAQIKAGALEQTLKLAAAGGTDLASAAGYIVQGLNTYGLKAKQAGQVTTALAGGANASTASVESLGRALSQVGPGAVNAGMSIQETVAALAAFDNAGIKGSDAGTTLKTMLTSLVPQTDKARNAMKEYGLEFVKRNGDFKSMSQIAGELQDGLKGVSQAERTAALRTIFGSDATRAATVLMKEGTKGVQGYIKATKDRAKTQQMADSAMEGASGAWENFTGTVETAAIQIGRKLLPAFTVAANKGADFINEVMTWGPALKENLGWVGDLGKALVGPLKLGVEVVKTLTGAFNGLPDPVKQTAIQVGIAALAFPRLSSMAASAGASVTGAFTRMKASATQYAAGMTYAATRTQQLGQAAKVAAGIGGMVLLSKSASSTNEDLKVLGATAGGAMVGFSMAGPLGGIIGGAVGGFASLRSAMKNTAGSIDYLKTAQRNMSDGWDQSLSSAKSYGETLDQVTGKITAATRAYALQQLQQAGLTEGLRMLGVSQRDAISAAMGQSDAMKRVSQAGRQNADVLKGLQNTKLSKWIDDTSAAIRREQQDIRGNTSALTTWKQALSGVPKKVQTELKAMGYKATKAQVEDLVKGYKDAPKLVKTILKALGAEGVIKDIDKTKKKAGDLSAKEWALTFGANTGDADKKIAATKKKATDLGNQKPTPKAGFDTGELLKKAAQGNSILTGLSKRTATPNATLIDRASGMIAAVAGRLHALDGQHATVTTFMNTVHTAINRTVNAGVGMIFPGHSKGGYTGGTSPKEVRGFVHGQEYVMDAETTKRAFPLLDALHKSKGRMAEFRNGGPTSKGGGHKGGGKDGKGNDGAKWWKGIVSHLVAAMKDGAKALEKTFDKTYAAIRKRFSGQAEKRYLEQAHKLEEKLGRMMDRRAAVADKLKRAEESLANLRETKANFIQGTTAGMTSQATVLNAGNNAGDIQANLATQVAKVKEFAGMLRQLKAMGYSNAIVDQVGQAGVEGGIQAAKALVAAQPYQVQAMNQSFAEIQSTAKSTAKELGATMYDAGIQAAEGLVKGLKDRRKAIQNAMTDIVRDLHGGKHHKRHGGKKRISLAGDTTPTLAGLQGGTRAGASVTFAFTTNNPQAEPQSRTTNKALAKVATLGLV